MTSVFTKRNSIIVSIIMALFFIGVLPLISNFTQQNIPSDSPDTTFFYTMNDLYQMAENHTSSGRRLYIILRFTFDFVFPLVYGSFLFITIGTLQKARNTINNHLLLIPILGVLFDFLENITVSIVMARYPSKTDFFAFFAPIMSVMKWIGVIGGFIILAYYVVTWIIQRIMTKQKVE